MNPTPIQSNRRVVPAPKETMAPIKKGDGDWLASLARQSSSADTKAKKPNNTTSKRKRKGNNSNSNIDDINNSQDNNSAPLTKAQRIERREQKKDQREERKRLAEEARQQRLAKNLAKKRQWSNNHGSDSVAAKGRVAAKKTLSARTHANHHKQEKNGKRGMTTLSQQVLTQLSTDLNSTVSYHAQQQTIISQPKRLKKKKQESNAEPEPPPQLLSNGLPAEPKGKATKNSTLRPESKELQPRTRDYNGQGLVRNSLYLPFNDPSYVPKLELEFEEHVPGFFGKSKTKAAKKQSGKNMLWRRCLKAKEEEEVGGSGGSRKRKKKETGLDVRVEGMMQQGVM